MGFGTFFVAQTNLKEDVLKCGFPVSRKDHYLRLLEAKQLKFQIVDSTYGVVENYSDYMNNDKLKELIQKILDINFDEITFKEAYEILLSTKNNLCIKYPKSEKLALATETKQSMYIGLKHLMYAFKEFNKKNKLTHLNNLDVELNLQKVFVRIAFKKQYI